MINRRSPRRPLRRFLAGSAMFAVVGATMIAITPGISAAVGTPSVTAVTPNRGPANGGVSIVITGTDLAAASSVLFGATPATSFTANSATQITVTTAHISATVDITVVTPGGTSLTSAADVYTYEKVLFTDSFTNATTAEPMYLPAGTGATNVACLTAGSSTTQTPIPDCASSGGDTAGMGAPSDPNAGNLEGSAFYSTSLPTANGLDLTFNTYQYGSASEADGIAFSLGATDPANPSAPVNMGPAGGHLGYSGGTGGPSGVGLAHGYMGFGLDVFGNFTNSIRRLRLLRPELADERAARAERHDPRARQRHGRLLRCRLDAEPLAWWRLGGKKLDNVSGTDTTVRPRSSLSKSHSTPRRHPAITSPASRFRPRAGPSGSLRSVALRDC